MYSRILSDNNATVLSFDERKISYISMYIMHEKVNVERRSEKKFLSRGENVK